jgi:hypothetical protein
MGRYTPPWRLVNAIAYGVPLMVVAAGWLIRRELARRAAAAEIAGATGPLLLAGIPAEAATAEAVPIESVPTGTVPVGTVPAGTVPAGTVPAGTAPTGGLPTGFAVGQRALSADAGREVPV